MKYLFYVWFFISFALVASPLCTIQNYVLQNKKNHKKDKKPIEKLHDRFIPLLNQLLEKCKTINTAEDLSQVLLCFTFIKSFQPDFFNKHLKDMINVCFDRAEKLTFPENAHFFQLQPFFDFWYLAKLHHRPTHEFIPKNLIMKALDPKELKKRTETEALVSWSYLQILKYCAPDLYRHFKKFEKRLITEIQKHPESRNYYQVLSTFYATAFGKKQPVKKLTEIFDLQKFDTAPLDIKAHLFLHARLAHFPNHLIEQMAALLNRSYPTHFQELCLLTACAS